MDDADRDTLMRMAAFEHVRRLGEVHDHLTATELKPGFVFDGERIPLVNPQRGIFKPQQMRFLLLIKTVFPKPGGKVWYDDQPTSTPAPPRSPGRPARRRPHRCRPGVSKNPHREPTDRGLANSSA